MGYDLNSLLLNPSPATESLISINGLSPPNETFPSSFTTFLLSGWFWPDGNSATPRFSAVSVAAGTSFFYGFTFVLDPGPGTATLTTGNGSAVAASSNVVNFTTPTISFDTWLNVLCSVNVATSTAQLYIQDVAATVSSHSWVQGSVHSDSGALAGVAGQTSLDLMCIGDIYMAATASFFDLSVVANRRKFIDEFGFPVDLGTAASSPTGAAPQIYLSIRTPGAASEMLTNRGTGGADFITNPISSPTVIGTCVELPLPPVLLSCGAHTATSTTFVWEPNPFGGTPDHYNLIYRKEGDVDWIYASNLATTSYTATGLEMNAVYEWQVAALRDNNPSDFTSSSFCSTGTILPVQPVPNSLLRWRGQVGVNWKGMALVGDAFDGVVGLSDFANFTEYGNTMQFLVTTPPLHEDRKRIFVPRFEIEVEAGQGLPDDPAMGGTILLDWSKDGGVTWSTLVPPRSMGAIGEYIKRLRWLNLGNSRTWVFRLRCSDPIRRYIIGTYLDQWKGIG